MHTVHGFAQASYDVVEGERLDTMFGLNVKGSTNLSALDITGAVTSETGTARMFLYLYTLHWNTLSTMIIKLKTLKREILLAVEPCTPYIYPLIMSPCRDFRL